MSLLIKGNFIFVTALSIYSNRTKLIFCYVYFNKFTFLFSNIVTSKSFIKANSRNERGNRLVEHTRKIDRLDSLRGSTLSDTNTEDTFGPLSNVR